jgi:hypothetical protein
MDGGSPVAVKEPFFLEKRTKKLLLSAPASALPTKRKPPCKPKA